MLLEALVIEARVQGRAPAEEGLRIVRVTDRRADQPELPVYAKSTSYSNRWIKYGKPIFDTALASIALILIAPILIAISMGIKLSGGPVLYRQQRLGRGGKAFNMLKFRTMMVNTEGIAPQLSDEPEPLFKMRRDPRITRFGATLRRYSLDELPQLFNVITGKMSLVGPRPPLPRELEGFDAGSLRRLAIKPGYTGLWTVSGRSDLTWLQRNELDDQYAKNASLLLDLEILVRTFVVLVSGYGAY